MFQSAGWLSTYRSEVNFYATVARAMDGGAKIGFSDAAGCRRVNMIHRAWRVGEFVHNSEAYRTSTT